MRPHPLLPVCSNSIMHLFPLQRGHIPYFLSAPTLSLICSPCSEATSLTSCLLHQYHSYVPLAVKPTSITSCLLHQYHSSVPLAVKPTSLTSCLLHQYHSSVPLAIRPHPLLPVCSNSITPLFPCCGTCCDCRLGVYSVLTAVVHDVIADWVCTVC